MYDVAIIGAGVIGASIFRELTKYDLKVTVLEKENDVSMGTSKANSAIVHAGYDPKVGTLMAKYNVKGNEMFEDLCKELSVPFKRNGSLIIAFSEEDMETVKNLYENGNKIGVKGLQILSKEEVLEKLKDIMVMIYKNASEASKEYGDEGNILMGANIAGFLKVCDAMMAQGIV